MERGPTCGLGSGFGHTDLALALAQVFHPHRNGRPHDVQPAGRAVRAGAAGGAATGAAAAAAAAAAVERLAELDGRDVLELAGQLTHAEDCPRREDFVRDDP